MQKLLLLSIVALTIAAPAVAASGRSSKLGLQKTVAWMLVGIVVYVGLVAFVYGRLQG